MKSAFDKGIFIKNGQKRRRGFRGPTHSAKHQTTALCIGTLNPRLLNWRTGQNRALPSWPNPKNWPNPEGGASYVPSYVPYVSHKLRLRVPLRVPYKSHTSPIRAPLRMSLRVPYVSRTCPVRVPYVSRTCPIRQENLHAVRASRMRWKSRSRVTRRGQQ